MKQRSVTGEEGAREGSVQLTTRAFRDLLFNGNVMQVQANPYSEAIRYPTPYPLVAPRNRIIDVAYPGINNLAGNTVAMASTDISRSSAYKDFDCANIKVRMNYMGMAIRPTDKNKAVNRQMATVVATALSDIWSTATSTLPIFTDVFTSDMPNLESGQAARTAGLIWYQTFLQNCATILSRYREVLSLEDYLISMGWNVEAPQTVDLMSKMQRRNVKSALATIQTIVRQEYFDTEWFREMNVLNACPARAADDSQEALMTFTGAHAIPKISITTVGGTKLIDTVTTGGQFYDDFNAITLSFFGVSTTLDLEGWFQTLLDLLTPSTMLEWARDYAMGTDQTVDATYYVNQIITIIDAISDVATIFKSVVADMRTLLDVSSTRTILNTWSKGIRISVDERIMQTRPMYYKVLSDIAIAAMTSSDLVWDGTTMMWKLFTMWDEIIGIPEYDKQSGGMPLIASVRGLPSETDANVYSTSKWLFPIYFRLVGSTPFEFVNRSGTGAAAAPVTMTNAQLEASRYYAYLNLIGYSDATLGYPYVDVSAYTLDIKTQGTIQKFLANTFGVGSVKYSDGTTNMVTPSEKVGLYDLMIPDHAAATISFLEAKSPFRVKSDYVQELGFISEIGRAHV